MDRNENTTVSARNLYEKGGDALASLLAYQSIWEKERNVGPVQNITKSKNKSNSTAHVVHGHSDLSRLETLSRCHNLSVLSNLCAARDFTDRKNGLDNKNLDGSLSLMENILNLHGGHCIGSGGMDCNIPSENSIQSSIRLESEFLKRCFDKDESCENKIEERIILPLLIMRHNLALILLSKKRPTDGRDVLMNVFCKLVRTLKPGGGSVEYDSLSDDILDIACKICFLLLDCLINFHLGDELSTDMTRDGKEPLSALVDDIFEWIESYIETLNNNLDSSVGSNNKNDHPNELKFRLHLYKARVLFFLKRFLKQDSRTRQAKKELKSALELYNHKLSSGSSGFGSTTGSLGSSSDNVHHDSSIHTAAELTSTRAEADAPPVGMTQKKLDVQNQYALYLKANLENLKGNAKKSLKLCAEARLAGERFRDLGRDPSPFSKDEIQKQEYTDEAIHFNNLGILHQSVGKVHAAMHYYSKAVALIQKLENSNAGIRLDTHCFASDGVSHPVPISEIYHNVAICAIQTKKWLEAYKCMNRCITASQHVFATRPRCWLRMAECCIGLHVQKRKEEDDLNFKVFGKKQGLPPRVVLGLSKNQRTTCFNDNDGNPMMLSRDIGSIEDIHQLSISTLPRALFCLQQALALFQKRERNEDLSTFEADTLEAIKLSLAYVTLELHDPLSALHYANAILDNPIPTTDSKNQTTISNLISMRRKATARMYACEASYMLGDVERSRNILFGKNNATHEPSSLNKCAKELAMIPKSATALSGDTSSGETHEKKLRDANTALFISASGVMAASGEIEKAGKYALMALKGVPVEHSDLGASARRALLHWRIRQGETDGALASILCMP